MTHSGHSWLNNSAPQLGLGPHFAGRNFLF
jgi:hypothetical protein